MIIQLLQCSAQLEATPVNLKLCFSDLIVVWMLDMRSLSSGVQEATTNHHVWYPYQITNHMKRNMCLTLEIHRKLVHAFVEFWIPVSNNKPLWLVAPREIRP